MSDPIFTPDQIAQIIGGNGSDAPFDPNEWEWVWDGPLGGVYKSNKRDIYFYVGQETRTPPAPPKAATGGSGSGSTNPTNVYISQNPGQLYTDRVSDGSDGYPPGTIIQTNNVTGADTVKYKPSAAPASLYNDTNNDGYDDQSGLPLGVVKVDKAISPTGLVYQGKPVNADGSLYTGSSGSGKPDAPTWTGYGPKGQGTYYLDGPNGTAGTFIGATQAPSSASTNISVSGVKGYTSSGGGGSSSAAASRDYAAEAAQQGEIQKQLLILENQLKNDPNNPYLIMQQQQLQLQAQQMANTQQNQLADRRLQNIKDFESAVSDTDQAKLTARRLAMGGDVSIANLLRDNPEGFQANDAAAALLAEIRGQGGQNVGGVAGQFGVTTPMTPVSSPASGAPGSSPSPGAPPPSSGMTPVTTLNGGTLSSSRGIDPAAIQANQDRIREQQRQQAYDTRSGWEPTSTPAGIVYREIANGQPTGKTMSPDAWSAMQQQQAPIENPSYEMQMMDALQNEQARAQAYARVQGTPYVDPLAGMKTATGGPAGERTTLYQWGANDWRTTNQGMPGTEMSYGKDDISRPMPTTTGAYAPGVAGGAAPMVPGAGGPAVAPTNSQPWGPGLQYIPGGPGDLLKIDPNATPVAPTAGGYGMVGNLQPRAITPLARGGVANSGLAVVGDSVSGRPTGHEELLIDPTHDARVIPLHGRQMRGIQHWANGGAFDLFQGLTDSGGFTGPVTGGETTSVNGMRRSPYSSTPKPVAPQPMAPVSPVAQPVTQPAPQPVAQPVAQPVQQPVAQPTTTTQMQPVSQPAPQTAGGSTVPTQPAFNPLQPTAITPEQQAYMDEIKRFRDSQNNLAGVAPLDVGFGRLAPTYQQAYYDQMKTRTGIPIEDQMNEQRRYAFAGRGRSMSPLGY